ncbi:MAG: hypothetical protein QF486_06765 [Candidatus Woesearchaeota archaeon]|jgi:hypothetical protein|nr:hypothetical protein [Candidatus Woesearchaeota archaeon]MDP7182123.1 hypothetical protein [Candidatus Woesearchaeota archaeon]MDP7199288.1 hypothetical protein [Candidatus Woesearchaeota archaeon]MDP7467909.1 hypothetical protein [Candidatus Woesearchaeota archaeon]MDP7647885.1 hypothetical protein [Candidatus Woesearchaeota archaeon]|tara:strand:- start:138 stop:545 length:408 start_codon:yes stop_codon:yes gene_type:complete
MRFCKVDAYISLASIKAHCSKAHLQKRVDELPVVIGADPQSETQDTPAQVDIKFLGRGPVYKDGEEEVWGEVIQVRLGHHNPHTPDAKVIDTHQEECIPTTHCGDPAVDIIRRGDDPVRYSFIETSLYSSPPHRG